MIKGATLCFGRKAAKSQIIIQNCKSLSNLLDALKYYKSTQENFKDEATVNMAMEIYFNEEYKNFLEDYNHIICTHSEHLEEIHKQLGKCEISQCKMAHRYSNDIRRKGVDEIKSDNQVINTNSKLNFYLELLDIIHFWLYHQYDSGMRVKRSIFENDEKQTYDIKYSSDHQHFDAVFAKLQKEIMNKRQSSKTNRYSQNIDSAKYKLHVADNTYPVKDEDTDKPLLDTVNEELKDDQIPSDIIVKFTEFIKFEEYDTDAFIADIIEYQHGCNVITAVNDQQFVYFIERYAGNLNSM